MNSASVLEIVRITKVFWFFFYIYKFKMFVFHLYFFFTYLLCFLKAIVFFTIFYII